MAAQSTGLEYCGCVEEIRTLETDQRWKDDLDHRGFASHSIKFLHLPKGNMTMSKTFSRKTTRSHVSLRNAKLVSLTVIVFLSKLCLPLRQGPHFLLFCISLSMLRTDRYRIVLNTLYISCIVCKLALEFPVTYVLLETGKQGINYFKCL